MENELITEHNLDFLSRPYPLSFKGQKLWMEFKVGTCSGLWQSTKKSYIILAIRNAIPNNGHLNDVLQWFEHSCRRDKKSLVISEFIINQGFKKHLIDKRGFITHGKDDVIKKF